MSWPLKESKVAISLKDAFPALLTASKPGAITLS